MSEPLQLCLVLVTRDIGGRHQVLLGEKRRGFGLGRLVAPGGKVDAGETPAEAAVRELEEETGLVALDLTPAGVITFQFPAHHEDDRVAHVFTVTRTSGRLTASDELAGAWFDVDRIPYERMWADSRYWLPLALGGGAGTPTFLYADDRVTLAHILDFPEP